LPTYDRQLQENDKEFVAKKLGVGTHELEEIFQLPNKEYSDYASNAKLFEVGLKIKRMFVRL
jgi:hypothetical protein